MAGVCRQKDYRMNTQIFTAPGDLFLGSDAATALSQGARRFSSVAKAVRFAMKDGSKKVTVLVSSPALENIELAPIEREAFKHYRKSFERIASEKYAKGHVEADGTVCIRAMDVPAVSAN